MGQEIEIKLEAPNEVVLEQAMQAARQAADLYGWHTIPCLDEHGRLRDIDTIHEALWQAALPLLTQEGENDGNTSF